MAADRSMRFVELPDLPASPHQPSGFVFTKCLFGKAKVVHRSFQESWFKEWPLLHYMTKRKMSHFTIAICATAVKEKKI